MKDKIMKIALLVVTLELVLLVVGTIFAVLGIGGFSTGCFYRYDIGGGSKPSDSITTTVSLNANANYSSSISHVNGQSVVSSDTSKYGSWKRAGIDLNSGQTINVTVNGSVSLCKSYIPTYNIGSNNNTDKNGNRIAVPRVSDNTDPLTLIFDAKTAGWRNLVELYPGDIIDIAVEDNTSSTLLGGAISSVSEYNIFTGGNITADCTQSKKSYSPICGRWSLWNGGQDYVNQCIYNCKKDAVCGSHCCDSFLGVCFSWFTASGPCYNTCAVNTYNTGKLPVPYLENGSLTYTGGTTPILVPAYNTAIAQCGQGSGQGCSNNVASMVNAFNANLATYKYWFSARDVGGLLYRVSGNPATSQIEIGGGSWAAIMNPSLEFAQNQYTGRKIMSQQYGANNSSTYLQYRFYNDPSDANGAKYANHTGGYVFKVKHTKCYRKNGAAISDAGYNKPRGQILYVVSNTDPGTDPSVASKASVITTDINGKVTNGITVPQNARGDIWFKIDNNEADYKDSQGVYTLQLGFNNPNNGFVDKILTPLISTIKNRVNTTGLEIFQNFICYNQQPNGSCTNFFNYVKALLTLYVMIYGMMFLSGMVKASYKDIVIRVVKIGLVAGLLSGQTFLWFQEYVFNFVIDFTDQIIANFSGFSAISSVNSSGVAASNYTGNTNISGAGPFIFLDTIFTKMFMGQTFWAQLMAIMGMGLIGLLYFVIVGLGIVIMLIVCLRAVAVYIIAMIAIAFLISLAPMFLTFMLFSTTYYLFENWYKALFRYMMEPVILMIGVIVLLQIFTMYIDEVLSYSVCWKCALSFNIPFASLVPLPGLQNIPLFCINWFGPWGLDNVGTAGQIGMDLGAMLGLLIVAFAMYGYGDLAQKMASQLTAAGPGAPSSIGAGNAMAQSFGQAGLRRFGLDDQTRAAVKRQKASDRLESRQALKDRSKDLDKRADAVIEQEKKMGIHNPENDNALKKRNVSLMPDYDKPSNSSSDKTSLDNKASVERGSDGAKNSSGGSASSSSETKLSSSQQVKHGNSSSSVTVTRSSGGSTSVVSSSGGMQNMSTSNVTNLSSSDSGGMSSGSSTNITISSNGEVTHYSSSDNNTSKLSSNKTVTTTRAGTGSSSIQISQSNNGNNSNSSITVTRISGEGVSQTRINNGNVETTTTNLSSERNQSGLEQSGSSNSNANEAKESSSRDPSDSKNKASSSKSKGSSSKSSVEKPKSDKADKLSKKNGGDKKVTREGAPVSDKPGAGEGAKKSSNPNIPRAGAPKVIDSSGESEV